MSRFALFGSPIDQSPSPAMHNAAFAAAGLEHGYELRSARAGDGKTLVEEMGPVWSGANVTTPLKVEMAEHVNLVGHAARAQALNTLYLKDDKWCGELTDVEGITTPLLQRDMPDGYGVILGAGGAARAAALALAKLGLDVVVAARRVEQGKALLKALKLPGHAVALDYPVLKEIAEEAACFLQATPVGREGEVMHLPWDQCRPETIFFEMVYLPQSTPQLAAARSVGLQTIEGWEMLLAQGARAWELWTGKAAPVEVMKQAVLGHLAESGPRPDEPPEGA